MSAYPVTEAPDVSVAMAHKWRHILAEMFVELVRARRLYPDSMSMPNGTGGGGRRTWEAIARNSCERADREGRLTHAHVFDEEASEVLAADTDAELRKELVQVGAVCLKWIADIDARGTVTK